MHDALNEFGYPDCLGDNTATPLTCANCGEVSTNPGQFLPCGAWVCTAACKHDFDQSQAACGGTPQDEDNQHLSRELEQCPRCEGSRIYNGDWCALCGGKGTMQAAVKSKEQSLTEIFDSWWERRHDGTKEQSRRAWFAGWDAATSYWSPKLPIKTCDLKPLPHQLVVVAGGVAVWTGSIWLSKTGDDNDRVIQWPVKWWMPMPMEPTP